MSSDDHWRSRSEPTPDLRPVAAAFAALLVGPLVGYWAARLVASAVRAAARRLLQ